MSRSIPASSSSIVGGIKLDRFLSIHRRNRPSKRQRYARRISPIVAPSLTTNAHLYEWPALNRNARSAWALPRPANSQNGTRLSQSKINLTPCCLRRNITLVENRATRQPSRRVFHFSAHSLALEPRNYPINAPGS